MDPAPSIRVNIVANFIGKFWTSLVSLIFIPIYIRFMGIEAYGLIGVYISLLALFAILDMGLSSTLSRQLARLSTEPNSGQESVDIVRTLEIVYWAIGLAIGAIMAILAPLIARRWLTVSGIAPDTATRAIMIMGVVAAVEWPSAIYSGALLGLQRQVRLNVLKASAATCQSGGAVLVLWLVSPTITAYFAWQAVATLAQTAAFALSLRSVLAEKRAAPPRFRKEILVRNWRFAAGMTGISAITTIVTQLDKVILSRLLRLEAFGYYVLAFNIANALASLVQPIFSALFPRLSQLVAYGNETELARLYHAGCRLLAVAVLPICVTAAFFPGEILDVWMNNPDTTRNTFRILGLLMIGTTINAILTLPYALQLSFGWTKLSFYKNVVALPLIVPSLLLLIHRFGAEGAAIVWIAYNGALLLSEIPLMHRRILRREMISWYIYDVLVPLSVVSFVVVLSKACIPSNIGRIGSGVWIGATIFIGMAILGLMNSRMFLSLRAVHHEL